MNHLGSAHLTVHHLIQALEQGRLPERLAQRALEHLRELCPECDRSYREFTAVRDRRSARRDYGDAFRGALDTVTGFARLLESERHLACQDLGRLLATPPAQRLALVEVDRLRFRSPVLLSGLIEEAAVRMPADPPEALSLLDVADAVGERLGCADLGEAFVERLRLRVEAHRAEALRLAGELQGADFLWRSIHRRRERCTPIEPEEAGELATLEAALRRDQRRFAEAERLLRRAEREYRQAGDCAAVSQVLLRRGSLDRLRGDTRRALANWRRAAERLDPEIAPGLHRVVLLRQAAAWLDLGDAAAAEPLLATAAATPADLDGDDDPAAGPLLTWLTGRLALAHGRPAEAAAALDRAREGYLALRHGLDAALVTLDLAGLALSGGDGPALPRLAAAIDELFAARQLHAEALRALRRLARDLLSGTLTADLLARLRRYLELARNDRGCAFDPDAPAPAIFA